MHIIFSEMENESTSMRFVAILPLYSAMLQQKMLHFNHRAEA
jgi:hypothetical protein